MCGRLTKESRIEDGDGLKTVGKGKEGWLNLVKFDRLRNYKMSERRANKILFLVGHAMAPGGGCKTQNVTNYLFIHLI